MTAEEKAARVRCYFELMTRSDIDGIVGMFAEEAEVLSPFLGRVRAPEFFRKLGNASRESRLTVFEVLLGEDGDSAAAHFEYDWTLADGQQFVFQGIDHFRFAPDGRFAALSIFYDTHPVREQVGDKYANA